MGEETKKFLFWCFLGLLTCIIVFTFGYNYFASKKQANESIVLQRDIGLYKITAIKPAPDMNVDLQDVRSGEMYKNVFVSKACPSPQRAQLDVIVPAEKLSNYRLVTMEKFITFDKLYEFLCTNKKLDEKPEEKKPTK